MKADIRLQIEKYLADELLDDERKAFEQLLLSDANLAEDVSLSRQLNLYLANNSDTDEIPENELTRRIQDFLKSNEAKELKQHLQDIHVEATQKPKYKKLWIPLAAAAVLLLFIGLMFFNEPSNSDLYKSYYNEKDLPRLVARGTNTYLQTQGIISFQQKEYNSSIQQLTEYFIQEKKPNISMYLYRGMAYLEMDDVENAILDFDRVINSDHLDSAKGLWFKGLLYLKTNEPQKAREVFRLIVLDSSNYKYTDSLAILKALE